MFSSLVLALSVGVNVATVQACSVAWSTLIVNFFFEKFSGMELLCLLCYTVFSDRQVLSSICIGSDSVSIESTWTLRLTKPAIQISIVTFSILGPFFIYVNIGIQRVVCF